MQILFRISQSNDKKGNPKNPDLDFLIEIHPEDGFLGGEICEIGEICFLFSIAKSEIRISQSNATLDLEQQYGFTKGVCLSNFLLFYVQYVLDNVLLSNGKLV